MSELHLSEFFALLKKSELLSQQQWVTAQATAKSVRASSTADALDNGSAATAAAAELVKQQLLTPWQSSQLLKGQTGFVLQQYRLLAPVGKGGMGHVFQARDDRSGAIVAIKVMSRKLAGNQTLVNRFRREIRASSLLNSPHIVRTLDAGRVGKVDFMVMEYVNGDQLDNVVARVPAVPVPIACDIIRQVAIGLQHAHEQKMVHRDIKPGNLIVDWSADGRGTVKIMDMGLVRLGDDGEQQTTVTKAGQVMGTPDYMSPEQGWDTATVDIRSDLYSLGCTFFRLLTGRVPFPGDNPLQVLMARCSKDAPSAKSLRADIPDVVDAILRKMTVRDPGGRFQTPQALLDALTPLSSPLTTKGLRKAMRDAGTDDAVLLELATESVSTDSQDPSYQQFLREMEMGAAVDLMTATEPGHGQGLSPTLPILPQMDRRVDRTRRPPANRSRTAGVIALAAGSGIVALLAVLLFVNGTGKVPTKPTPSVVESESPPVTIPEATLASAPPMKVQAGQTLLHQPTFAGKEPAPPAVGELNFCLGVGSPAFVEIDADTGEVTWHVSAQQISHDYEIFIELVFVHAELRKVISATTLIASVEQVATTYSLSRPTPRSVQPNEAIAVSLVSRPEISAGSNVEFRLSTDALPGMTIDPTTGEFAWTPAVEHAGLHTVTAELFNSISSQALAQTQLHLLVMPVFPELKALAGELLQIDLPKPPPGFPARVLRLRVAEGNPPGVTLDPQTSSLQWAVPSDASGRYEIRLQLDAGPSNRLLRPNATPESLIIVVKVGPAAAVAPVSKTPSEPEIIAAEAELRELFKKELATARAAADRAVLARKLLERSFDQTPGAADYALLNLAAEQANRGRAMDVALEVNHLQCERYSSDELASAKAIIAEFRPASLGARQQEAAIEHCLRLASIAAAKEQFNEVAALLTPPDLLLKKLNHGSLNRLLAEDVTKARAIAEQLSGKDATTAEIQAQELKRLLQSWQFADLFAETESLGYVQAAKGPLNSPDSGKSLWQFGQDRIRLETGSQPFAIGFIDTGSAPGRYVVRMQLAAKTTSAVMILGAGPEATLNAYMLTLDNSGFGRITVVPGQATVASQPPNTPLLTSGWNDIEVLVDGPQVEVRLNGAQVLSKEVTSLKPGRLGMLVSLERAVPAPVFDMRNARILMLPD